MNWTLVLTLAAIAYSLKALGLVVLGGRQLPATVDRSLALIPVALITALVVKDTLSAGQELVLDARLAGVTVAVVAAWRRWPFVVVVTLAVVVTALIRA